MLNVFLKSIHYVLGTITAQLASKNKGESEIDVLNYQAGGRVQQLALLHSNYYTLKAFVDAHHAETNPYIKPITADLCLLFGIGQVQRNGQPIV